MSALVSRMEHSTIVEGQRLGRVHIMEGTFFREVYTHIHIHIHTHIHVHINFQQKHVPKHVRVRGWVVGCVVGWCGVVWCVDVLVSFSLVFSKLKLVRSKGFFR